MSEAVFDNAFTQAPYAQLADAQSIVREPIRWRRFVILFLLLPFFGGTFSYVKNLHALWALTKAFPIISVPLIVPLFWRERIPFTRQLLITLLYMFLVPSFTGMFSFHQNFFLGLTSQVKLLPMLFFFSFIALLYLLDLNYREVATAFLTLAGLTFAILLAIWAFAPSNWYETRFVLGQSSILTVDDRGQRIRMPMYFGMIGIFYTYRRFFAGGRWRVLWLATSLFLYSTLIFAVKTRAYVVAVPIVLAINAVRLTRRTARLVMLAMLPFLVIGLGSIPLVQSLILNKDEVREATIVKITGFLGTSVPNWAFGVGSISPLVDNGGGMIQYFNHFFYLADVTWVGVIFEFGLIGAALFLCIPLRGIWMSRHVTSGRHDAFFGSLQDYLVYALVGSPMTAIILAPGELTVIVAVFVYFTHMLQEKRTT